jgi:CBS domain containing-hemolysin-like protein
LSVSFETVGGFLLSHLGRTATGETFCIDSLYVEVIDAERRRVRKVRIRLRNGSDTSRLSEAAAGEERPGPRE